MLKAKMRKRDTGHARRWGVWLCVAALAPVASAQAAQPFADYVLVDKSEHTLTAMSHGKSIAVFKAGFGVYPGPKEKQGDRKTPEGRYLLDYKNENSAFYRSIHISYPNNADRQRARRAGYKTGGDIMVHGWPSDPRLVNAIARWPNNDWTDGCISLANSDMKKFWDLVRVPVPIEIRP